jgi:protein arginine kinase activator
MRKIIYGGRLLMRCNRCEKRKATVHLTEVDPETKEKRELHLCENCAHEQGIAQKQPPINELLSNFILAASQISELSELKCEACGMNFLQFRQSGLLGCPNDYDAFTSVLVPLLEKAHDGASSHVGKRPGTRFESRVETDQSATLMRLRSELARAVKSEDYETAANLRDKIQEMEKNVRPDNQNS